MQISLSFYSIKYRRFQSDPFHTINNTITLKRDNKVPRKKLDKIIIKIEVSTSEVCAKYNNNLIISVCEEENCPQMG